MNPARFLVHVAHQQRVSECRCARKDWEAADDEYNAELDAGRCAPGAREYVDRLRGHYRQQRATLERERQAILAVLGPLP